MPLIQNSKILYEQNREIFAVYYRGQKVWPAEIPVNQKLLHFWVEQSPYTNRTTYLTKMIKGSGPDVTIEYSTDMITWNQTTSNNIPIESGKKTYLRANTSRWALARNSYTCIVNQDGDYTTYKIGGNILSLEYGENFDGTQTSAKSTNGRNFQCLFCYENNEVVQKYLHLDDASNLYLNTTILRQADYSRMFMGTGLRYAPKEIEVGSWAGQYQMDRMFRGCTLRESPILKGATSTTMGSFAAMFDNCSYLNKVTNLFDYDNSSNQYNGWLNKVSSTGTFVKKAGVTWPEGASGIPSGWTVVEV